MSSSFSSLAQYRSAAQDEATADFNFSYNTQHSILYRLPQELFDAVVLLLGGDDQRCLQASCRRPSELRPSQFSRTNFREKLRMDQLWRAIDREDAVDRAKLDRPFCSQCYETHLRDHFTPSAIMQLTPERACIAASRTFRICRHLEFSFEDMLSDHRARLKGHQHDYVAAYCTHRDHLAWERPAPIQALHKSKVPLGVSSCIMLFQRPHAIRGTAVCRALFALDEYICPHLKTSSPAVLEIFAKRHWDSFQYVIKPQDMTADFYKQHGGHCPETECKTSFMVGIGASGFTVLFSIARICGDLKTIRDRTWLAQVGVDQAWARQHGV